ncbi:MAG TPA: aldose epimerase family protein [Gammaproteobacteria bacterium]|nr:aldose epimerase family protein [Gammaproteobacteria bacterium]
MSKSPTVSSKPFGQLPDGAKVDLYTLANRHGTEARIMTYGGTITSLRTRDRAGELADIVLGFDELEPYLKGTPYFGALIGRYGNRIAKGLFTLDGKTYTLDTNGRQNHLHGGVEGFDKRVWSAQAFTDQTGAGVKLNLLSPDGDQGYPGNLRVTAVYTLTDDDRLIIDLRAVTDRPTLVNLTHHSYFNLAAEGDILNHRLTLNADRFTPVDSTMIPTGELRFVNDTPFDFRKPVAIGARIDDTRDEQIALGHGYDHNFVLNKKAGDALQQAARVVEPESGRVLEIWTEEPGIQFYTANFLNPTLCRGKTYSRRCAFCLEPQHYPDSPNQPDFPSTVLRPGEQYATRTVYKFGVE